MIGIEEASFFGLLIHTEFNGNIERKLGCIFPNFPNTKLV
jgi:hypothetical protein